MNPKITKSLDVYVRVSDTRGRSGDSFISPRDQEDRCRALAKARGYRVGEVFTDLDKSGGTMDRPEFNKALGRIRSGVSGGLIVARMDRFSRSLTGAIATIEEIDKAGGYLIECDGDWDTSTPMGRFGRDLVIRLAQLYREQISDNWVTAKRDAVNRGIHITRHAPPGYIKEKGKPLTLNPERSAIVQEAFSMAASGEPYARIADYLTEHGIATTSNRVKRLLSNRVYLGEARNGHGDVNVGAHPALVDAVTWSLAQRETKSGPTLTKHADNLLSGLARCASCSFSMRPQKARGTTVASYRCTTVTAHGRCPGPSTISATRVEEYVADLFAERLFAAASSPVVERDDSKAIAAFEDARQAYAEVEALKDSLRPAAYAKALDSALEVVEAAEAELTTRPKDTSAMIPEALALLEQNMASGERPLALVSPEGRALLRSALGDEVQAVFVRPAASRQRNLAVSDRVHIVWKGEEELELPRRGASYEPRAYVW